MEGEKKKGRGGKERDLSIGSIKGRKRGKRKATNSHLIWRLRERKGKGEEGILLWRVPNKFQEKGRGRKGTENEDLLCGLHRRDKEGSNAVSVPGKSKKGRKKGTTLLPFRFNYQPLTESCEKGIKSVPLIQRKREGRVDKNLRTWTLCAGRPVKGKIVSSTPRARERKGGGGEGEERAECPIICLPYAPERPGRRKKEGKSQDALSLHQGVREEIKKEGKIILSI